MNEKVRKVFVSRLQLSNLCWPSRDEHTSFQQEAVVVMPEDSPGVKVSAVRDTYGAEAGVQNSAKTIVLGGN